MSSLFIDFQKKWDVNLLLPKYYDSAVPLYVGTSTQEPLIPIFNIDIIFPWTPKRSGIQLFFSLSSITLPFPLRWRFSTRELSSHFSTSLLLLSSLVRVELQLRP
mmetsp:Transcript_10129/g.20472  ORF Transcript_10129/g.20472 Transcript_10129/m.20472 type:complete len:105 (+) Transcript_10129:1314-1628(+)